MSRLTFSFLLALLMPTLALAQADFDYTCFAYGGMRAIPISKDTLRTQGVYQIKKVGDQMTVAPINEPTQVFYSGKVSFVGSTPSNQALIYNGIEGSRLIVQPLYGCLILITGPNAQKAGADKPQPDLSTYNILGGCAYDPTAAPKK